DVPMPENSLQALSFPWLGTPVDPYIRLLSTPRHALGPKLSTHVKHPCHVDFAAPPLSHVAPRHALGPKCMQACLVASDMSSLLHVDSIFRSAWCRYDPAPPSAASPEAPSQ